jgi:hypothetical protein
VRTPVRSRSSACGVFATTRQPDVTAGPGLTSEQSARTRDQVLPSGTTANEPSSPAYLHRACCTHPPRRADTALGTCRATTLRPSPRYLPPPSQRGPWQTDSSPRHCASLPAAWARASAPAAAPSKVDNGKCRTRKTALEPSITRLMNHHPLGCVVDDARKRGAEGGVACDMGEGADPSGRKPPATSALRAQCRHAGTATAREKAGKRGERGGHHSPETL